MTCEFTSAEKNAFLKKHGYSIVTTRNGWKARKGFKLYSIDSVFCSLMKSHALTRWIEESDVRFPLGDYTFVLNLDGGESDTNYESLQVIEGGDA